jgi:hypothetical protein
MKIWLTRLHGKIRDAVREWLLGEESRSIATIAYRSEWMGDATLTYGKALVGLRDGLSALRDSEERHYRARLELDHQAFANLGKTQQREFALIQTERIAGKAEQKRQYDDLLHSQQEMEQKLDRLLALVEPKAQRLRDRAPAPPDWDEVQRQNLNQFEETGNGPVRR